MGLLGRLAGSWLRAALMAAWTSRAAPLMSRSRSNCRVMPVEPELAAEVISLTPAIGRTGVRAGWRPTEAMVSGLGAGKAGADGPGWWGTRPAAAATTGSNADRSDGTPRRRRPMARWCSERWSRVGRG